jgi:hypothetical protein
MLEWKSSSTPKWRQLIYQARIAAAQLTYFDRLGFRKGRFGLPKPARVKGYQSRLAELRNRFRGHPCTVICNGPSLADVDPRVIQRTISIGCNGLYKKFGDWGFSTHFLVFEDVEQFELRAADVSGLAGPTKMAAIYNAYALASHRDWLFFNAPRCQTNDYYWDEADAYPQFSEDFASIVHLGSTVTYVMLQLAFHLGCDPVVIVGLNHDYGRLPELFPPGKIPVTHENYPLVQQCHFDPAYYKVGDVIGVPWVARQETAYRKALEVFRAHKRQLLNATAGTKLLSLPIISTDDYERLVLEASMAGPSRF